MQCRVALPSLIESLENSPHRKRCLFELPLLALFWGTPKVFFSVIEAN
jgi:hypothetical protein